jgi:diaminohydroxyphosphoribosylaminopyrimidine deaminase/5-amino-6-(5-phosphoribosylamino)uracil reductase
MTLGATIDPQYMQHAINLALRASRQALPNPCVGAVLVHNNAIIGQGYHQAYGEPHAEPNAIKSVKDPSLLIDSTLHVTLEPCAHYGKTPPCADLIIEKKIPRVVVGCRDPFPHVAGRGIQKLLSAGVQVIENVLHDECVVANKRFILAHTEKRPYIILKWAQTEDGYLAPENNIRAQISSPESQELTHYWRGQEMAILIGANTARIDNPLLTVRYTHHYQQHELPPTNPQRIILAGSKPIPTDLLVWNTDAKTLLVTPTGSLHESIPAHIERCILTDSSAPLTQVCATLYQRSILSVLVEGGSETLQSFLDAGLWDEIRVFVAPTRFGHGVRAPTLERNIRNTHNELRPASTEAMNQAPPLRPEHVIQSGGDTLKMYVNPELRRRLGVGQLVRIA